MKHERKKNHKNVTVEQKKIQYIPITKVHENNMPREFRPKLEDVIDLWLQNTITVSNNIGSLYVMVAVMVRVNEVASTAAAIMTKSYNSITTMNE